MKECPCLRRICQCFATLLVVSHFVQSIKMLRCLNIMVLLQWWHDWMYLLMLLRWFRKGGYLVYNLYCMGCFERYVQERVIVSNDLIIVHWSMQYGHSWMQELGTPWELTWLNSNDKVRWAPSYDFILFLEEAGLKGLWNDYHCVFPASSLAESDMIFFPKSDLVANVEVNTWFL